MGVSRGEGGITRGARAGILLNVVLICALAVAVAAGVIAIVRRVSYRTDLRFDLTHDARYALSEEQKALLRTIESPIDAVFCWGIDEDIFQRIALPTGEARLELYYRYYEPILLEARARITRVLEEWSKISPHIRMRVISQDQSPQQVVELARSLDMSQEEIVNTVVLQMGSRRREVPLRRMMEDMEWGRFSPVPGGPSLLPRPPAGWHVHGELTSALRSILTGKAVRIGVPRGKDAALEPGTGPFLTLAGILDGEAYQLESLELAKMERVPAELDLLLIPGVQKAFDTREKQVLQEYERTGGRLMIVADPRFPESYAEILEPYGCTLLPGIVEDRRRQSPQRTGPEEIESSELCIGRHPIDAPLKGRVALYIGPSRPIAIGQDHAPGAERVALLEASDDAQFVPYEFESSGRFVPKPGARRKFAAAQERRLAAALRRPAEGRQSEARIVLFGGTGILSAREMFLATHYGNRDLVLNALAWLSNRTAAIGSGPRDEVAERVVPLDRVEDAFFGVAVIGLPLLGLVAAFLTYLARRQ